MGMDQKMMDSYVDHMTSKLPVGYIADGDDIAYAIMFLAAKQSSYITGSNLVSDGGHLAANLPFA